jgi:hypothetical protein
MALKASGTVGAAVMHARISESSWSAGRTVQKKMVADERASWAVRRAEKLASVWIARDARVAVRDVASVVASEAVERKPEPVSDMTPATVGDEEKKADPYSYVRSAGTGNSDVAKCSGDTGVDGEQHTTPDGRRCDNLSDTTRHLAMQLHLFWLAKRRYFGDECLASRESQSDSVLQFTEARAVAGA